LHLLILLLNHPAFTAQTIAQRSFAFSAPNFLNSKQPPPKDLHRYSCTYMTCVIHISLYIMCNLYTEWCHGIDKLLQVSPDAFLVYVTVTAYVSSTFDTEHFFPLLSDVYSILVSCVCVCVLSFSLRLPDKKFEEQWITADRKSKPLSRIRRCIYSLIVFIIIALFSINLNVNRISFRNY